MVHGLTFARFVEVCRTISQAKQDEAREKMTLVSFLGWQMAPLWGYKGDYAKYLRDLGLLPEDKPDPVVREQKKNQALSRAARIIAADKRRG